MNIKNITLVSIAFFLAYPAICLTIDSEKKSEIAEQQISPEQWQQLIEMHEKVMDQTHQIEFCLQTIDQIISHNKINIDTNITSKSEILEQIRMIKKLIESFALNSQAEMQNGSYMIIQEGLIFNQACCDYLLPIFYDNINKLNIESFNTSIMQAFKNFNGQSLTISLEEQIEKNKKQVAQLITASENIGLSSLNKLYRYLDRQPLPITGKSTFATAYDIGKLTAIGLAAYATTLYLIPNNMDLPIFGNSNNLWGRKYIGAQNITEYIYGPTVDPVKKQELLHGKNPEQRSLPNGGIGFFGGADYAARLTANPLLTYASPILVAAAYPYIESGFKYTQDKFNRLLNYYGQGDASTSLSNTDYVKAYFKDIVGGQELEQEAKLIADYIKNPIRYERQNNSPATGYLLVGPSQTGKSFFAKALRTLIDEQFADAQQKVGFINITAEHVIKYGFARIFEDVSYMAPVILFIDELDMHGVRRARNEKNTQELLTAMNGMTTNPSKKIIVIAATNRPEELDFALKQKGRFGNIITFDYPTYQVRKEYLLKQLHKQNITISQSMIDTISKETEGQTFNMIDDIIRQARQVSTYKLRPIQEEDFEKVLDKEIRKIKPNITMSQVEEDLVATYQAGQAVARQLLATERKVVKITIDAVDKPIASKEGTDIKTEEKGIQYENFDLVQLEKTKNTRLGYVFTSSSLNHRELMNDEEEEKEIIALLAGQAALELIKGKTFSNFGKEDRAQVLHILEKKISQGTPITYEIRQQALAAKDSLYAKAKSLLQRHIPFITSVADILKKQHAINALEWASIIKNIHNAVVVAPQVTPQVTSRQMPAKKLLAVKRK